MDLFPLPKARGTQSAVIKAIENAYKDGYKNVIVEAPVGSGKSAIAITLAKSFGAAHILTPRKSLQDQYGDDFQKEDVALMKGRSGYPCTFNSSENPEYKKVIRLINEQKPLSSELISSPYSCATGPCISSRGAYKGCVGLNPDGTVENPCPYSVAGEVAQRSKIVVHNFHSFIYQTKFGDKFHQRPLLIIDEAHEIEGICRGFSERKIVLPLRKNEIELPTGYTLLEEWADWFLKYGELFSEVVSATADVSEREEFLNALQSLIDFSELFGEDFVTDIQEIEAGKEKHTRFVFTPVKVGATANSLLFNYGERRLLLSGTVYSKSTFCKNIGLNDSETLFIQIPSSFPVENRPIYCRSDLQVDTSFAKWDENFKEMTSIMKSIMTTFDDVKGIIHTPSYNASLQIYNALKDTGRIMWHTKDDLSVQLQRFYDSTEPKVFLSPSCYQGVDFKEDRARFQIIVRVPNPSTQDAFIDYQRQSNFPWYNYQALITFGQQIGRVVRSETDEGSTILLDSRFHSFLSRNRGSLPKWLRDSIIYK